MNKLVAEIRAATESAVQRKKKKDPTQPIFEYDSDEDCEGGTWEHRKRFDEMMSTLGESCSTSSPCLSVMSSHFLTTRLNFLVESFRP